MCFISTPTLIPLHRVATYLGIDPYHFSQIYTSERPFRTNCDDSWFQRQVEGEPFLRRGEQDPVVLEEGQIGVAVLMKCEQIHDAGDPLSTRNPIGIGRLIVSKPSFRQVSGQKNQVHCGRQA